jgi:hypothetical protein
MQFGCIFCRDSVVEAALGFASERVLCAHQEVADCLWAMLPDSGPAAAELAQSQSPLKHPLPVPANVA